MVSTEPVSVTIDAAIPPRIASAASGPRTIEGSMSVSVVEDDGQEGQSHPTQDAQNRDNPQGRPEVVAQREESHRPFMPPKEGR